MSVIPISSALVSNNATSVSFGSTKKKYSAKMATGKSSEVLKGTKYAKSPIRNFIKYTGAACAAAVTMLFTGCSPNNEPTPPTPKPDTTVVIPPTPSADTVVVTPIMKKVGSVSTAFAMDSVDLVKADTFDIHEDWNGADYRYKMLPKESTPDTLKFRRAQYAYGIKNGFEKGKIYVDGKTGKLISSLTYSLKFNDSEQIPEDIDILTKTAKTETTLLDKKGVAYAKYVKSGIDEAMNYSIDKNVVSNIGKKAKVTFKLLRK